MLKAGDPFIPCSIRCDGIRFEPVIDENWKPSKQPLVTHHESATLQGVHDDVILALRFVEGWKHFAERDELPDKRTMRQAVLWARMLDNYLNGQHVAESAWLTFAEVHVPMNVHFHGEEWPSYHFAAATECCFWLSVYEQAANGYGGTLGCHSTADEIVSDAIAKWPLYVERAKQYDLSPMVSIQWNFPSLMTACEVEFRNAVEREARRVTAEEDSPKPVKRRAKTLADGASNGKTAKGKRGRRKGVPASDVGQDQRIADAWAKGCGEYASQEKLAAAFGIEKPDVVAALDRHRKRPK